MQLYRGQRISSLILDREQSRKEFLTNDLSLWYEVKIHLLSPLLQSTFSKSSIDLETEQFLGNSFAISGSMCLQILLYFLNIIAFQFKNLLLEISSFLAVNKLLQLLDLGAGDGGITTKLSPFYGTIYTTEMSQVMQWRLRQQNFHEEDVEKWSSTSRRYNLISALNLLDRHYNPKKLLSDLHELALHSNCYVLMAVVLPVHQYVEFRPSSADSRNNTRLKVSGNSFEQHASSLVENEFIPAGFEVVKWTKLPYLCEGDLNKPYYLLDDALFLLRPVTTKTQGVSSQTDSTIVHNEL
ncbi:DREV methyltransferase [Ancylostoma caninum]|uniref:DREV methyltransferase n=1 Tax=Ancylostoma caninum TaxID=29170 RepID=A0A368H1U9_ANCCA|nr:DREV methyltransferase [Ancylostoma caninum]